MIDVLFLPAQLDRAALAGAQVVVFDVLRATSTIVTALSHGAREVRLFGTIEEATAAKAGLPAPVLLAGERKCVKPAGFDMGNSPAEFVGAGVAGATICLTTTNGTVAALAARGAQKMFVGSLLNAGATARELSQSVNAMDTLLLCAGTEGRISSEDVLGAGAVLFELLQLTYRTDLPFTDAAWIAYHAFAAARARLPAALRLGQGGVNLIRAKLESDIDLCAALDAHPLAVSLLPEPLRAVTIK